MIYNTQQKKLVLPEYGRHIHNMVEHCLSIEDRDERTRCARTVITTMGNLFPHLRDVNDFKHILWDHLAIMSDFQLDIDYPYEIIKKENLYSRPDPIAYSSPKQIRYMHYGKMIQELIDKAVQIEDQAERDELVWMIANQMKKCYIAFNKDSVEDRKIFDDIRELSKGKINLSEEQWQLCDCRERDIPLPSAPTKKQSNSKQKRHR